MSEKKKGNKTLSKSSYIRGRQCLKSLYLYKNRYFLRDPIPYDQQLKFRRGHRIGDLAHELFPGGVNLSPGHPSRQKKASEETRNSIEQRTPVIYEAVFITEKYVAIMDILVLVGNSYHAWEVKSSLRISETYLQDLAFQYFVMSQAGFVPERAGIIHVNPEYVLDAEIEPEKLFIKKDLTQEIVDRQHETSLKALEAYKTMLLESSPQTDVGVHCFSPYPCEFYSHCHKPFLKSPVLQLAGLNTEMKYSLLKNTAFTDGCFFENDFLNKQCKALITGKDLFDMDLLAGFFDNFSPDENQVFLYVFSIQNPLPKNKGDSPFARQPLAAAIIRENTEYFAEFHGIEKPLHELMTFIQEHSVGQVCILENEELLPDNFLSLADEFGITVINLHEYFLEGIWCSRKFAPDYSSSSIRNSVMASRPQYFDRLALLLDIEKNKTENPKMAIRLFTLGNCNAIRSVFGRLYSEFI